MHCGASFMHAAPAQDEIKRLARDVYQDDTKKMRDMIMEWFSQRHLSQLLQKEEKRKASLDAAKSGAVAVEAAVVRIVDACVGKNVALPPLAQLSDIGRGGAHDGRALPLLARTSKGHRNGLGDWQQGRRGTPPCDMGGYIIAS